MNNKHDVQNGICLIKNQHFLYILMVLFLFQSMLQLILFMSPAEKKGQIKKP